MGNKIFYLISFIVLFNTNLNAQVNKTYLALGDSYTIGESVEEQLRWPNQLVDSLKRHNIRFEKPIIIAQTGWRSDELIHAVEKYNHPKKYDLVSLLIGVNNQYQNKDIEIFKRDFLQLINMAIQHSKNGGKGVFVLSIPDYGVTPFGQQKEPQKIEKEINRYNAICENICSENNIPYYNITEISRMAKTNSSLIAEDGLHPSGKMYALWVEAIIKKELINTAIILD